MTKYHVPGSGNAQDPANAIYHARLDACAALMKAGDTVVIYGRQQPGQRQSEADSGELYLRKEKGFAGIPEHELFRVVDEYPKSISETMARVAQDICYNSLAHGRREAGSHCVLINWPYVPRSRYLLRRQWERLFPDIPWQEAVPLVHFPPVSAAMLAQGWAGVPRWIWKVLVREMLATVKARLDPYDTKYNQKRGAAKIF